MFKMLSSPTKEASGKFGNGHDEPRRNNYVMPLPGNMEFEQAWPCESMNSEVGGHPPLGLHSGLWAGHRVGSEKALRSRQMRHKATACRGRCKTKAVRRQASGKAGASLYHDPAHPPKGQPTAASAKLSDFNFNLRLATEQDPVVKEAKSDAENLRDMILQRLLIGGVFVSVLRDEILVWRPTVVTAPKHTRNAQELAAGQDSCRLLQEVHAEGMRSRARPLLRRAGNCERLASHSYSVFQRSGYRFA